MTDRIGVAKSSPSTNFYLEADLVGTSGNSSIVRCYLRATNAGNSSSFFGNAGFQAGAVDGIGEFGRHSGNPFLPSGYGAGATRWRDGGWDVYVGHDANGYGPTMTLRMTLVYGNVNEGHTAQMALPRIPKVPQAPTMVSLSEVTATSFKAVFSGNDNGGSAITGWQLQVATNAAFTTGVENFASNGTSTISGRTPGTQYWVRSRGSNGIGWSNYSGALTTTTLGAPPAAPTGIILTTTPPDEINVDWLAPVNTGGKPITGYDVQRALDPGFTQGVVTTPVAANLTEVDLTGLTTAVLYYIRVRAKNVDALGDWGTAPAVMIPAGGKAWTGSTWKAQVLKAWTGSIWRPAVLRAWNGTSWVLTK